MRHSVTGQVSVDSSVSMGGASETGTLEVTLKDFNSPLIKTLSSQNYRLPIRLGYQLSECLPGRVNFALTAALDIPERPPR